MPAETLSTLIALAVASLPLVVVYRVALRVPARSR